MNVTKLILEDMREEKRDRRKKEELKMLLEYKARNEKKKKSRWDKLTPAEREAAIDATRIRFPNAKDEELLKLTKQIYG